MDDYRIRSTSSTTAVGDDILLRTGDRVRLVFRPKLLENEKMPTAGMNGTFIYQKKAVNDVWEDTRTLDLNKIKKGEIIQLHLHASELLTLYKYLESLYGIRAREGVPFGDTRFVKADEQLLAFLKLTESDLGTFFEQHPADGVITLVRLLSWATRVDRIEEITGKLAELDPGALQQLSTLVGITQLRSILAIWEKNRENTDEGFWQELFSERSIVLSQLFSYPVVVISDKAYVGGKSIFNTGGNLADFLLQNALTKNAIIVEIKTPTTQLLGGKYRNSAFSISSQLTGAVVQVLQYKNVLTRKYDGVVTESSTFFDVCEPHCIVIAGTADKELVQTPQKRSFELFRSQLGGVEIVTFDELFEKLRLLLVAFQPDGQEMPAAPEAEPEIDL